MRRVEDITEALWGRKVSPATISELNKKAVVGDKCLRMLEAVGEVFPEAKYQRCTVHFSRNVFSVVPHSKMTLVAKMLRAIHA